MRDFLDDTSKHHHHGRDCDDADDFETAKMVVGGRGAGFFGGPRGRVRGKQIALFCVVWVVEQQKREEG